MRYVGIYATNERRCPLVDAVLWRFRDEPHAPVVVSSASFMMGTFKITVNSATSYERGTCADITVGAKLRVTGTTQTDGSILASAIEVKESHDDGPGARVEGEGIITGLKTGTSCPTLTFFVESMQ